MQLNWLPVSTSVAIRRHRSDSDGSMCVSSSYNNGNRLIAIMQLLGPR